MKKDSSDQRKSPMRTSSPSFIKLAMKNMVKKGNQSLVHFGLTAIGFVLFIVAIAVLGRPTVPH